MGCGSTKVIPEPYHDKRNGSRNSNKSDQSKKKKSAANGKEYINDGDKPKQNSTKSSAGKYRAKFDPRVVSKYEIRALIGRGSFSHVVRVQHKGTGQQFAIKMIDVKQKEGREVCESELRVLRRVRHIYIVQLVEVFEAPDKSYMVMELAKGGELFDRIIARGSFSERDAVKVLQMVLEGVRYLHSLGITHRDLKPENLLYFHQGADSKILITDFGLASSQRSGNDNTMTVTCGTPEYIAPEILLRKPYTCSVDAWALGVITYILLSGTMPFDHEEKPVLFKSIIEGKYTFTAEPWPHVSRPAIDFVQSFLSVDPARRMSPAQGLKHPWIHNNTNQSNKNLVRTISQNILKRASSRNSNKSAKSVASNRSLRSQHRKVNAKELDDLLKKYERY